MGIIPACAGNRSHRFADGQAVRDHPRVCGEQQCGFQESYRGIGSSPRVRGTEQRDTGVSGTQGIIPACAGNSCDVAVFISGYGDHPRVCGEQHRFAPVPWALVGSSPRVRGTDHVTCIIEEEPGIIPACAGNRHLQMASADTARDHPRVCGEQTKDPQLNITHPS